MARLATRTGLLERLCRRLARRRIPRALLLRWAPLTFVRLAEPDRGELGRAGERLAERHLTRRGLELLGRRVRTPAGEVDLVLREGAHLVAVEVKTSRRPAGVAASDRRWRPGRRFDRRRAARQRRAALLLLRSRRGVGSGGEQQARARVDLVEVTIEPGSGALEILHHRGATWATRTPERRRRSPGSRFPNPGQDVPWPVALARGPTREGEPRGDSWTAPAVHPGPSGRP